jgi:hypothetical protein
MPVPPRFAEEFISPESFPPARQGGRIFILEKLLGKLRQKT